MTCFLPGVTPFFEPGASFVVYSTLVEPFVFGFYGLNRCSLPIGFFAFAPIILGLIFTKNPDNLDKIITFSNALILLLIDF